MRTKLLVPLVLLFVASLALPVSAASVPPPSGTVDCTIAGLGNIKPPLNNTPSTKKLVISGSATSSSCDNSGVTGGKGPIAAVAIKFSLTEPDTGYTCTNYDLGYDKSKLQVKWQYLNPAGHLRTLAVNNTTIAEFSVVSIDPVVVYKVVSAPITKGAFAGSTITLFTALDDSYPTLIAQCNGAGISAFGFGHINSSSASVP